jgi:hypothetical protein
MRSPSAAVLRIMMNRPSGVTAYAGRAGFLALEQP